MVQSFFARGPDKGNERLHDAKGGTRQTVSRYQHSKKKPLMEGFHERPLFQIVAVVTRLFSWCLSVFPTRCQRVRSRLCLLQELLI